MYTGPNIVRDGLVFGYDTGYGVADNNATTRHYPGEPTTNAVPLSTFINTSNWTGVGWSGAIAVSTDYDNTLELTSTNGWRTWRVNTGITSGGTVTVSYEYRMKTLATTNVYMLNLNGDHLGSYVNNLGSISAADTQDLSNWKTFTGSWTANPNSNLAIGLRGVDSQGLTDTIYVRNLQVELKGHVTPYTTTTRSSTASLIDLTKTTDIDVSNVSFDSTGQPEFDGTDDWLNIPVTLNAGNFTYETVIKQYGSTSYNIFSAGTGNPSSGGTNVQAYVNSSGGLVNLYAPVGGSGWNNGTYDNTGNFTATSNVNYHIVVVNLNTTWKIYVNGNLVGDIDSFIPTVGNSVGVARSAMQAANGKNSRVSLTKIYNRALTATEVKQNFKAYKNRFGI